MVTVNELNLRSLGKRCVCQHHTVKYTELLETTKIQPRHKECLTARGGYQKCLGGL